MPNLNEQPWTKKNILSCLLDADVELEVIPVFCFVCLFFFQDLVEDFVFPASKLIVEARNGSGTCGPLKTFHVVQKERIFLCVVYLHVQ